MIEKIAKIPEKFIETLLEITKKALSTTHFIHISSNELACISLVLAALSFIITIYLALDFFTKKDIKAALSSLLIVIIVYLYLLCFIIFPPATVKLMIHSSLYIQLLIFLFGFLIAPFIVSCVVFFTLRPLLSTMSQQNFSIYFLDKHGLKHKLKIFKDLLYYEELQSKKANNEKRIIHVVDHTKSDIKLMYSFDKTKFLYKLYSFMNKHKIICILLLTFLPIFLYLICYLISLIKF